MAATTLIVWTIVGLAPIFTRVATTHSVHCARNQLHLWSGITLNLTFNMPDYN
jgi:hypothetical protein